MSDRGAYKPSEGGRASMAFAREDCGRRIGLKITALESEIATLRRKQNAIVSGLRDQRLSVSVRLVALLRGSPDVDFSCGEIMQAIDAREDSVRKALTGCQARGQVRRVAYGRWIAVVTSAVDGRGGAR